MIYVNVTTKEWIKRHPALEISHKRCDHCGKKMVADIPVLEAEWASLYSKDCECGETPAFAVSTPTSIKMKSLVGSLFE